MTVFKKNKTHGKVVNINRYNIKLKPPLPDVFNHIEKKQKKIPVPESSPYAKIRLIAATSEVLKVLGIQQKEAFLCLEVRHGDKKLGELKRQIIPLFVRDLVPMEKRHSEKERFDSKRIANFITNRAEPDKYTSCVAGGSGLKLDTSVFVHIPTSGGEFAFELMPKGTIKLTHVPVNLDLSLESLGDIEFSQDFQCRTLDLSAKSMVNTYQVLAQNLKFACSEHLINSGVIFGEQSLLGSVFGKCLNQLEAILASAGALDLTVGPDSQNHGWISGKILKMSGADYDNTLHGKLFGEEQNDLYFKSTFLNNGGIGVKHEKGVLKLRATNLCNGLEGFIHSAHTLWLNIKRSIEDKGEIFAKAELNCKTRYLKTWASSKWLSSRNASIRCTEDMCVQGLIAAKHWMELQAMNLRIDLSGKIGSYGFFKLDIKDTLDNLGEILSGRYLLLNDAFLCNETEGLIYTQDFMDVYSKFLIENAGLLSGGLMNLQSPIIYNLGKLKTTKGGLTLKTFVLFENMAMGLMSVAEGLNIEGKDGVNQGKILAKWGSLDFKKEFKNSGLIETTQQLTLQAKEVLKLLRKGKINAKTTLSLLSDLEVYSEGDILAYQTLMVLTHTLKQPSGQMESKQDIELTVVDWLLAGNVKAGHDLVAKVSNQWDWKPSGNFEAKGTSALHLDKGCTFTCPIHAPGSLGFYCDPAFGFYNQTDLQAEYDLVMKGGSVTNGVPGSNFARLHAKRKFESVGTYFDNAYGGVFGGTELTIDHNKGIHNGRGITSTKAVVRKRQHKVLRSRHLGHRTREVDFTVQASWNRGNGSYLASNGSANLQSTQGGFLNEFSEVDIAIHLTIKTPQSTIDNPGGKIRVGHDGLFQAQRISHRMIVNEQWSTHSPSNYQQGYCYAQSDKPIFTLGGSAVFQGPLMTRGGDVQIGGLLNVSGGVSNSPVEECEVKINQTWTKGAKKKGRLGTKGHHYYWVYKPHKISHGIHSANVSGYQGIQGNNPHASYHFGSTVQTKFLDLQFSEMTIGNTIDPRYVPNTVPVEMDLIRYYDPLSRLFRIGGDPTSEAMISPEVPLARPDFPLPPRVVVGTVMATTPLFDERLEMRLVQDALADRTGKVVLNDTTITPTELLARFRQNALDYVRSLGLTVLTEESLQKTDKPMIVYRTSIEQGKPVLSARLIVPPHYVKPMEGVFAKNALLTGGGGSSLLVRGKLQIEERLKLKVDQLELKQRTVQDFVTVYGGKKGRTQSTVAVEKPLNNTGVLQVGTLEGEIGTYTQTGGALKSGTGGTHLTIEREAVVNALRTTEVLQGKKDFKLAPTFDPAFMLSEGNQHIIVTAGGFGASGLLSHAKGNNILEASGGIDLLAKVETYQLPIEKKKRGFKKTEIGGTRVSTLHNEFSSSASVQMASVNGNVHLNHTLVASQKETTFQGKSVILDAAEATETDWCHNQCQKGLTIQKSRLRQTRNTALLSTLAVGEDLIVRAQGKILLSGVQGLIQGNLSFEAPTIEIEGVKESMISSRYTKSFGINFFGSSALEVIREGGSARKALGHLLREDAFLNAVMNLARSRDKADVTVNTFQTFIEGWRLTALVGYACDQNGLNGSALLGSLTDRWGLTTVSKDGKRIFNPQFTFQWGSSRQSESQTNTLSSNLVVLGDIQMTGNIIRLKDGTTLSAKNISIMAQQLLEISAAENTYQSSRSEHRKSFGTTLREFGDVSVGTEGSEHQQQGKTHNPAQLNAQVSLTLSSEKEVRALGARLSALDLTLRGQTITFDSVQDIHNQSSSHYCANVGLNVASMTPSFCGSFGEGTGFSCQTVQSIAQASRLLTIQANTLKQTGSALVADDAVLLTRLDGQAIPVDHQVRSLENITSHQNTESGFSLKPEDSIPLTGAISNRNSRQENQTLATLSAPSIQGVISPVVNQNVNQQTVELSNQKKSSALLFGAVNSSKLSKDWRAIQQIPKALKPNVKPTGSTEKVKPEPNNRSKLSQKLEVSSQPVEDRLKNLAVNTQKQNDKQVSKNSPTLLFSSDDLSAIGQGIKKSGMETMDMLLHPIDMVTGLAITVWDGCGLITDTVLGSSTQGSRERNKARIDAIKNLYEQYKNGNKATRLEMVSEFGTSILLGGGITGIAGRLKKISSYPGDLGKATKSPRPKENLSERLAGLDLEPSKLAKLNPSAQNPNPRVTSTGSTQVAWEAYRQRSQQPALKPQAPSSVDAVRLKVELALREANILDEHGKLTSYALSNIQPLKAGRTLHNPKVIAELTKNGSAMTEWQKYTTREAVPLSNGQKIQVHFYMNKITNEVNYNIDYKVAPVVSAINPWKTH